VAVIFTPGEMTFVEYGNTEILGNVRTEFTSKHLFSLAVLDAPKGDPKEGAPPPIITDGEGFFFFFC
jgi:hypothetical protein